MTVYASVEVHAATRRQVNCWAGKPGTAQDSGERRLYRRLAALEAAIAADSGGRFAGPSPSSATRGRSTPARLMI